MNSFQTEQLLQNFSTILVKYFAIYNKLINKNHFNQFSSDPLQLNKIFLKIINNSFNNPEKMMQYQISFFKSQFEIAEKIMERFSSENYYSVSSKTTQDRRFKDNLWEEHCIFAWIKEAYFCFSSWLEEVAKDSANNGLTEIEVKRLNFIIKQFLDAVAPTNFAFSNPEVMRSFFESAGENFVKGLDNLLKDIENSKHNFSISNNDKSKFKLGENIAYTEGEVVYKNELIELLHYKPLTNEQYEIPLLIVAPFINKYYILDLQAENSMVKWLLEQGFNVFMISWVNPNEELANESFADYVEKGPVKAISFITEKLGISQINCVGYCIGGTLLATTASYLKALNRNVIRSITLFTTLIDFENAGDLSIFIDDNFIKEVGNYMKTMGGYLDGGDLELTFNLLRSNDMIWPYYINNYLLGKETFPFDLLYWNSDSTRLPMNLHLYYLKNMYKDNLLKDKGGIIVNDIPIDMNNIEIPNFVVACYLDHIVPWMNAFDSCKLFSGETEFILSNSGHVAGIINPPSKNKYSFWHNSNDIEKYQDERKWLDEAIPETGSWWPHWSKWLAKFSGKSKPAKYPLQDKDSKLIKAPGTYVKVRY